MFVEDVGCFFFFCNNLRKNCDNLIKGYISILLYSLIVILFISDKLI